MKRALLYARVSTKGQEDGVSLDEQLRACREYALKHNLQILREAREVYSGAELFARPVLNDCREEIKVGKYDVLVVYHVDRLSREMFQTAVILHDCERYNCKVVFVNGGFENTLEGKLMLQVRAYSAEVERLRTIDRTTRGRLAKAKLGTLSFRRKLYGYDLIDGKRVVNEYESAIVREMFDRFLKGASLREICEWLITSNIPTPNEKIWWAHSVKTILTNPSFTGKTFVFRQKSSWSYVEGNKVNKREPTADSEHIELPDITPPIISADIFIQAQRQLALNRKERRRGAGTDYLLRGLMRCANCGRLYSPRALKNGYRTYICGSKQNPATNCKTKMCPAQTTEDAVWSAVYEIFCNPQIINSLLETETARLKLSDTRHEVSRLESQIKKIRKEVALLVPRIATVSDTVWQIVNEQLEAKQSELTNLTRLYEQAKESLTERPEIDIAAMQEYFATFEKELTFEDKVNILHYLQTSFTWDGQNITMYLGNSLVSLYNQS